LKKLQRCGSLQEQVAWYKQFQRGTDFLANLIHATRRVWAPFVGVPDSQLQLYQGNVIKKIFDTIFGLTHIKGDNYFYYGYFYGEFTEECCPRYLKKENFATLKRYVKEKRVDVRTGYLGEVCASYPDATFTRYVLLDHQDWMQTSEILAEWEVFVRKSVQGQAYVLWRSFSEHQYIGPLKYLNFLDAKTIETIETLNPDRVGMYNSAWYARIPSREEGFTIVKRNNFKPRATWADDAKVLFSNFLKPISGGTHQEKLESFYEKQAGEYDVFRHRFLHGRQPMLENIPTILDGTWVDMGGGTAANLE